MSFVRTLSILVLWVSLSGCANFVDYFSPATAQAILIGSEDLPMGIELGAAAEATVFVARARSIDSFAANLIDDANLVQLSSPAGAVDLANSGTGTYSLSATDNAGLSYSAGLTYTLRVEEGGKVRIGSVVAPEAPNLGNSTDPIQHSAGSSLQFDLSGQGFDQYVAAVGLVDPSGDFILTYDNRPTTAQDYIDWIGPGGDPGVISIPGDAFPEAGASYVVGVAGLAQSDPGSFSKFNPAISNFVAGSLAGRLVVTTP